MEYSLTVNQNISENTSAAESRIRNLDMADANVYSLYPSKNT